MKHLFAVLCVVVAALTACTEKNSDEPVPTPSPGTGTLAYQEKYIDDFNALYDTQSGYMALFGYDSIPCGFGTKSYERIILVAKVDEKNACLDQEDLTVIVVDSTNFPTRIASKHTNMFCGLNDDGTINIAEYTPETGKWSDNTNLKLPARSNAAESRAPVDATGGYSDFNAKNVLTAISIGKGITDFGTAANQAERVSAGLGILGDIAAPNPELGLVTGLVTAGGLPGAILALYGYLATRLDDLYIQELGRVKLAINDISQIGEASFSVSYTISDLNENGQQHSHAKLNFVGASTLSKTVRPCQSQNGTYSATMINMYENRYWVTLSVGSDRYPYVFFHTMPVLVQMYDFGIDHYEFAGEPYFDDGKVYFPMNAYLKGDAEYMNELAAKGYEFGLYVEQDGKYAHLEISHLSSESQYTEAGFNLLVPYDDFNKKDFSSFIAESNTYNIGVYVFTDRNVMHHFGQRRLNGLVYKTKPKVTFTFAITTGTEIIDTQTDDEGEIISTRYLTNFSSDCYIQGSFWIKQMQMLFTDNHVDNGWSTIYVTNDGTIELNGYAHYWDSCEYGQYLEILLNNGSKLYSTNSLFLSCSNGNATLSVGGSRSGLVFKDSESGVENGANSCINIHEVPDSSHTESEFSIIAL